MHPCSSAASVPQLRGLFGVPPVVLGLRLARVTPSASEGFVGRAPQGEAHESTLVIVLRLAAEVVLSNLHAAVAPIRAIL